MTKNARHDGGTFRAAAAICGAVAAAGWMLLTNGSAQTPLQRFPHVAVTGARVVVQPGEVIDSGTIVIRDGRIAAVGPTNTVSVPVDAIRLDADGLTAYAGFIDAASSVGVSDAALATRRSGSGPDIDTDLTRYALAATRPAHRKGVFPDFGVARHVDLEDRASAWRRSGFAAVHTLPSDAIIAGTSAVIALLDAAHAPATEAIVAADSMLAVGWNTAGDGYPRSRMGSIAHLSTLR